MRRRLHHNADFLSHFGLESIQDLPDIATLREETPRRNADTLAAAEEEETKPDQPASRLPYGRASHGKPAPEERGFVSQQLTIETIRRRRRHRQAKRRAREH